MGRQETPIQRAIMLRAGKLGIPLWRNNVGFDAGNKVTYGLCKGSGDMIGIYHGTFLAVEAKSQTGRLSSAQASFRAVVESHGGIYLVMRSEADFADWANKQ